MLKVLVSSVQNRPFPSCFEPHYESEAKCEIFVMKISFHSHANKTNFLMKSFALSLASIVSFTANRKWPIVNLVLRDRRVIIIKKNLNEYSHKRKPE